METGLDFLQTICVSVLVIGCIFTVLNACFGTMKTAGEKEGNGK